MSGNRAENEFEAEMTEAARDVSILERNIYSASSVYIYIYIYICTKIYTHIMRINVELKLRGSLYLLERA